MATKSSQVAISESLLIAKLLDIEPNNTGNIADILRQIDYKLNTLSNDPKPTSGSSFPFKGLREAGDGKMSLSQQEWDKLEQLNETLRQDYTMRRQMLLTRVDCTIESFKWKSDYDKNKNLNEKIHSIYDPLRIKLKPEPNVSIAHLLAVKEEECDSMLNNVVSSNNIECSVRNTMIPPVPDRGGRPNEVRPPPKETFRFQQNNRGRGRGR